MVTSRHPKRRPRRREKAWQEIESALSIDESEEKP